MVKSYTDIIKTLDNVHTDEAFVELTSAIPGGSGNIKELCRKEITSNSKYSSRFNKYYYYPDD